MGKSVKESMADKTAGIKRVADFVPPSKWPDREKVAMDTILGTEIVIEGIEERVGENGTYLVIGIKTPDGAPYILLSGSGAVTSVLRKIEQEDGFPVIGAFGQVRSKNGRDYYTLT